MTTELQRFGSPILLLEIPQRQASWGNRLEI